MDYDARFKALLTAFFREFLELFFPEFAEHIDWRQAPVFLDKELQSIALESGPKTVDLLAKVVSFDPPRRQSSERLCLIHIEVEGRSSREVLGKRVSHYINRIDEKFDLPVVPIAIYLNVRGDGLGWQSRELTCWGHTIVSYHFPYIGLPALDGARYVETSNPVALALTGLMNASASDRARIKAEALRRIEKLKLDARQRVLLVNSLEAFTVLDPQQQAEFDQLLASSQFQKVREMQKTIYEVAAEAAAVVAEKRGLEKGRQEGRNEGRQEGRNEGRNEGRHEGRHEGQFALLERLLISKFGALSLRSRRKLRAMPGEQLEEIAQQLLSAEKLSDLGL